jgi:predicted regulator of amino acid metabolism with ACT domain
MHIISQSTVKEHIYTLLYKSVHEEKTEMWSNTRTYFEGHPERLKVARVLIENGLAVRTNAIYLNEIEIPPVRIARVAGVDRRTVLETLKDIESNRELRLIFEDMRSAGHSLKELAKHLGLGVVEITPLDAKTPGILAGSSTILAENGLSIRQAIVDDPELSPEPKLTLIVETRIPGELVPRLLSVKGVAKVAIY